MANFNIDLTINAKDTISASKSGNYEEVFRISQDLDNDDGGVTLFEGDSTKGTNILRSCKAIMLKNSGVVGAELIFSLDSWTAGNPDANGSAQYYSCVLGAGDFMFLPNIRQVGYSTSASAGNGETLDNSDPAILYKAIDTGVELGTLSDDSDTSLVVTDGDYYKVGDLLQLGTEIMEVTAISGTTLTVIRGLYGSTAVAHAGVDVAFPFFNTYADYNKYSKVQSDSSGRYWSKNLLGFGRKADLVGDGWVAGSISGKFYNAGFQECGMAGLTSSTNSGLTASTTYYFTIAVDGGSTKEISFLTGSNVKMGSNDGIIQKIQDALDAEFYDASSNLFEQKVTVGLVGGDIRFTSGQRLSTSAIALTTGSTGTSSTNLIGNAIGRFPASTEGAVASRLPDDIVYDKSTYVSSPNIGVMFYDDGMGNITGACTGSVNYETGEIQLSGCPANAQIVISANYGSAHAGGAEYNASYGNSITRVEGRSLNSKINTTVDVIGIR